MKYQKILQLVENFVSLADEKVFYMPPKNPIDTGFENQRQKLAKFHEHFKRRLTTIIGELAGDIWTLKERQFDRKLFGLLGQVYHDLIQISQKSDLDKPYATAEELIRYVTERPSGPIIDNLDYLAKHHIEQTNVDFGGGKTLIHPTMHSLDDLKKLVVQLETFMAQNPLLTTQESAPIPNPSIERNMENIPAFFTGRDDKTKS
jgi:hypothetical protein